jgi:hypothetical protein
MKLELGVLGTLYKMLVRKHLRNTQRRWEMYAAESGLCQVAGFGIIGV